MRRVKWTFGPGLSLTADCIQTQDSERRTSAYIAMGTSDKAFILDVIAKYKYHECLWQMRHEDYHNKRKRNRALDDIVKLFQTKDPAANRETVQKKLQTMRGSYKKELRKVSYLLSLKFLS